MGEDLNRRAHAILKRVIDVDPVKRILVVEEACAGDDELRQRVMALIGAIEESQEFLETPVLESSAWNADEDSTIEQRPEASLVDEITGFHIESVIGVGGMATVYKALQEHPRRYVALKVMKRGLVGTSALHRFKFETEVLARLKHAGIAQIFESGAFDYGGVSSVPYFALEYIKDARPLTTYADAVSLDQEQRLLMFAGVCDAVHHGHVNGVIHRDLKPGNILVDDDGHAKVIDFGIARSSDPEHESITRHTNIGQLIGTLNYMSPEQCSMRPTNLDLRTDVYSLGVVLYELMSGRLPHDLAEVPVPEVMRRIQQDEPVRPGVINHSLRGDLDAIILKALEKDPERRYRSVAELGNDIRHHLKHETIEARPLTAFYQLKRFTQRNRTLVAATLIVTVTLIVTTSISVRSAMEANREALQRAHAEAEAVSERDIARWQAYIATIAAAQGAYNSGEIHRMRTRLELAPIEHRSWEWNYLNGQANTSIGTIDAHYDMIFSMIGDAEMSELVTGCADGSIRVWDTVTQEYFEMQGRHDDLVRVLDVSPDRKRLVSGSMDGVLKIWDFQTGRLFHTMKGHQDKLLGIAFTLDDRIISISQDEAYFWDAISGKQIGVIDDLPHDILDVAVDHDRHRLVLFSDTGDVVVHDLQSNETTLRLDHGGSVYSSTISDDGTLLASGGLEGTIRVWNLDTGELLHSLQGSASVVRSLAFTHDGKVLAVGQGARGIHLWSMSTGQSVGVLRGHAEAISGLQFNREDNILYSSSWDSTIRIWDNEDPDPITTFLGHEDQVVAVAFSPDGSMVASGAKDNTIRLWDPVLGIELGVLRGHTERVYAVSFAPDGRHLYTGAYDNVIRIWDLVTGEQVGVIDGHTSGIWSIAFSPDGRHFASSSDDHTIRLYDLESNSLIRIFRGHEERVDNIVFSHDGSHIASASRDHSVRLWNIEQDHEIRKFEGHESDVFAVLFAPDGQRLISGSRDQTVRFWDIESGECIDMLSEHGQFITSLSLSPDGTRLAASSWNRAILLWDMDSGHEVMNFIAHDAAIRMVAFGPFGRRLVSCSYDRTVRVWDSATRSERRLELKEARTLSHQAAEIVADLFAMHGDAEKVADVIEQDERLQGKLLPWAKKAVLMRSLGTDAGVWLLKENEPFGRSALD